MAVQMGRVLGGLTMQHVIRVAIPRLKFDSYLMMHFRQNETILAHDPQEKSSVGDWVIIRELKEPYSLKVKHQLDRVVYENGNMIDPVTGKRTVGYDFDEDITRSAQMFGVKPVTEREFAKPISEKNKHAK